MILKRIILNFIVCVAILATTAIVQAEETQDGYEPLGPEESNLGVFPFPIFDGLLPDYALFFPPSIITGGPITYTVEKGDNLYRIALNHDIPLEVLISTNNLRNDVIHPGEELIIDKSENGKNGSTQIVTSKPHTVASSISPSVEQQIPKTKAAVIPTSQDEPPGEGMELIVTATAYTAYCTGCSGTTAYGIDLRSNPDQKVIAVDPSIIPLGTKVWVEGYGEAIAGDTGGAIKGHKIDVFIPSYENAMEWGVKKVKIKVLQ
ncbi:3D (Asp-Asp-Asp) domain-containing protein [Sporosarcina luteola]|nr:3D (Asp-Asp-Asp) domain-containing protein [Sporosarcina luteola]